MHTTRTGLAALALTMLLPSLGTSIAHVALPEIARAFDAPMPSVQWIVIAYLLAVTALIVTAGRLGDLFGRARLLKLGTLLFCAASLGAAFAPGLGWLIGLRAVQGAGAALMMALTLATVGDLVGRERTGRAMGLLASVSALGTALGPSLGGLLVARWGWPAVFTASALAALAGFLALHLLLPRQSPRPARAPLDLPGVALLSSALALGALVASRGAALAPGAMAACVIAVPALLAAFVRVERRAPAPLVDLSLLARPGLTPGLLQMALVSLIVMTTLVVGPFYLTAGLGLSPLQTGLVMSVGPGVVALVGLPAGRLVDRLGAGAMVRVGLGITLAGSLAMILLPGIFATAGYIASLAAITGGYGGFQAANATAVMAAVEPAQRGAASGLLGLARNLGLILGASLTGAVFTAGTTGLPGWGLTGSADTGLRLVFTLASAAAATALVLAVARRTGAREESPAEV